ncbi:hypothetical protein N7454_007358 [Penicillium verhagenii]|nr:hypothetical protein N7454_007358 [Penicillium verhagenii]
MGGVPWTLEETALLILFDMWGYEHKIISQLLTDRSPVIRQGTQHQRSISAVDNKLQFIRNNSNLWSKESGWDLAKVTEYISTLKLDHAQLRQLLTLSKSDCDGIINTP